MSETMTQMTADMKDSMRARDTERTTTIRMLISSLENKKIEMQRELTEEDAVSVLATEAKKRREAAQSYRDGERHELADKEERELEIIEKYLPQQLSDDEAADIVRQVIAEVGATTRRDMGKVMGEVMPQMKGRYDGSKVKDLVMAELD